jgi:hypothetical protein
MYRISAPRQWASICQSPSAMRLVEKMTRGDLLIPPIYAVSRPISSECGDGRRLFSFDRGFEFLGGDIGDAHRLDPLMIRHSCGICGMFLGNEGTLIMLRVLIVTLAIELLQQLPGPPHRSPLNAIRELPQRKKEGALLSSRIGQPCGQ